MSTIPPGNSIDSGSLTWTDTSSSADARQLYTPFNETAQSLNTTAAVGGDEGERDIQIQVSSTVQTVLIALGVVILVLFLMGIVAAYYISHKNKKAVQVLKKSHGKDMEEGRNPNEDDDIGKQPPISPSESEQADSGQGGRRGGGGGGGGQRVCEKGESGRNGEPSSGTVAASYVGASVGAGVGRGPNMGQGVSQPLTPGSESILTVGNINRSGANPFMTSRGSQSGPSELAAISPIPLSSLAERGCAGRALNKRNSIVDVAQTFSHRQSLLVNSGHPYYNHGNYDSNHSVDPTLPIVLVADRTASRGMNRLIDPFTTNNNGNASINVNINMAFATLQTTTEHGARDRVVDTLAIRSPPRAPLIPSSTIKGLPPSSPQLETPLSPSAPPVLSNDDWSLAPFERRSQEGVSRYRASLRGKGKGDSGLQQQQHQGTPVSVSVVLPGGAMVSNEISYQPPSQPTSPISRYASPTHQLPQKQQPQRSFRNGAAVFEGIPIPRTSIITNDVIRSQSKAEASHSQVENGHHESEEVETVIVSLPSPRGCLLEAEEEFANRFQAYMDQGVGEDAIHGSIRCVEYGIQPQKRGRHHHSMSFQQPFPRSVQTRPYDMDREEEEEDGEEDSKHPEESDHAYPYSRFRSTMSTRKGMTKSKVKSTYLDDYRQPQLFQQQQQQQQLHEQQQKQQQQEQQKQHQDDEGASGIVKTGRRLSTKLQSTLQRASFYST
ncbi:hypothetical protein BGX34_008462 [Mortierella sp. NVP85]|nr:hypothetical protein BGX34_008462 [Mortierella sp. NVP85]